MSSCGFRLYRGFQSLGTNFRVKPYTFSVMPSGLMTVARPHIWRTVRYCRAGGQNRLGPASRFKGYTHSADWTVKSDRSVWRYSRSTGRDFLGTAARDASVAE